MLTYIFEINSSVILLKDNYSNLKIKACFTQPGVKWVVCLHKLTITSVAKRFVYCMGWCKLYATRKLNQLRKRATSKNNQVTWLVQKHKTHQSHQLITLDIPNLSHMASHFEDFDHAPPSRSIRSTTIFRERRKIDVYTTFSDVNWHRIAIIPCPLYKNPMKGTKGD
jgi:hypothetical protein